jgi:predicted dehydrogenase
MSLPSARVLPLTGGPVLRWGVLAPGAIARDFVSALHAHTGQRVHAVASRSMERAEAFAAGFGIARAYDSYDRLVADPDIDVVYVAAPHSEHRALALLAIAAGKNVLVEKPIALNAVQAAEIAAAARAAGVFAMEAMWSRYLPRTDVIGQLLADGAVGEPRLVTVNLGWKAEFDAGSRMFDPALGGGAMLDAGVYSLWFSQFVLGEPVDVLATGSLAPTGVDAQVAVTMTAASGAQSSLTTTVLVDTPGTAAVYGTAGSVTVERFVFPGGFRLEVAGERIDWADEGGLTGRDGLAWQAAALAHYVAEGRTESPLHSLDDSIALMRTIDRVRAYVGAV